ncbi:hypothetical protein ACLX1H_004193 [Fusarium chlamydosporum]
MSFPGAAPPPHGVKPNLENPADVLRTTNYVTQALTLLFTAGFVATRFYAKYKVMGGGVTRDDAGEYGAGLNQWEVSPKDLTSFLK